LILKNKINWNNRLIAITGARGVGKTTLLRRGESRETLVRYLYLLEKADLLILLQTSDHGITKMNKPKKIYLNNPNLVNALTDHQSNQETLRETDKGGCFLCLGT